MKLYRHQTETLSMLKAGHNVVRAGSRRVGLTTSALLYIKWRLERDPFSANIHTRNSRNMKNMINQHNFPLIIKKPSPGGHHTTLEISNVIRSSVDFDLYDEVSPGEIPNQWALITTQGICIPSEYAGQYIHMEYVSARDNDCLRAAKLQADNEWF